MSRGQVAGRHRVAPHSARSGVSDREACHAMLSRHGAAFALTHAPSSLRGRIVQPAAPMTKSMQTEFSMLALSHLFSPCLLPLASGPLGQRHCQVSPSECQVTETNHRLDLKVRVA